MKKLLLTMSTVILLAACNESAQQNNSTSGELNKASNEAQASATQKILISSEDELKKAIKAAKAGDNLILKNGTYSDINIKFYGEGTKEQPITLKAETAGKVFIEGVSSLRLGGEYLVVEGLHFRNGYAPKKALVSFRIDSKTPAFHSKFTNNVIEGFTKLDRHVKDRWIELWGQHNELSNNYIAGKTNYGPTIMVELKGNEHVNNYHQIINNHFGPRPRQGGPHGETLQLGNSHTSMTPSHTNVENNFFDRCDGEVEIISSKSNHNIFRNNVFFESEGSLVLRHGNYAIIDGNRFIGNGENEFFGGIRVINTGHWVTNNYFYKIIGEQFRTPIAVMNGIPKSPLNRYNQVTDVVVAYNSFIETPTPWSFSVGTNIDQSAVLPESEIRSARPIRSIFANNLIFNSEKAEYPITNYDKVDGVAFENNISNNANKSEVQPEGLTQEDIKMASYASYIMAPSTNTTELYHGFDFDKIATDLLGNKRTAQNNNVGAIINPVAQDVTLIDKSQYGTTWFNPEPEAREAVVFKVATADELTEAAEKAMSGDIIELTAANYAVAQTININKTLFITSADKSQKATISFSAENTAFSMQPKGNLHLDSVVIKGNNKQNAFTTLDKDMNNAYNLFIKDTEIANFVDVLSVSKGSFADEIIVENSAIHNNQNGFILNKETRNKGDYNVEFLTITNSTFDNIAGSILDYHRGGYDESTIGGNLTFDNNTVTNSGKAQADSILLKNRGIVNVSLKGNTFKNNPVKLVAILWGAKGQKPENNTITNSGEVRVVENLKLKLMY